MRPFLESPRHPRVAEVRRLKARVGHRRETRRLVIEGVRLVQDALQAGAQLHELYVCAQRAERAAPRQGDGLAALIERARETGAPVIYCGPRVIRALSDTDTPQGVVAVVGFGPSAAAALETGGSLAVLVDGVQDPGNVGAIIRTAAAVGADAVLLDPASADPYGPKAVRASAGALFRVGVQRLERADALLTLAERLGKAGWKVMALVPRDGVLYHQADLTGRVALVVGSEARGVQEALAERCQARLTIPMERGVESLNVAVAAAVVLFETRRQRAVAGSGAG